MLAMNRCSMKSSSLVRAPITPLPPRRCARYGRDLLALDVAGVRDRDHHVLLLDRVLVADVAFFGHDLRAALVAVLVAAGGVTSSWMMPSIFCSLARMLAQLLDELDDLEVLLLDLRALEAGEAREPHLEDRVGLDLAELERAPSGPVRAVSTSLAARISAITASRWSSAILRPSRMWARFSASARSNSVRRRTTIAAVARRTGRAARAASAPGAGCSTSASMIAPNVVWSGECDEQLVQRRPWGSRPS